MIAVPFVMASLTEGAEITLTVHHDGDAPRAGEPRREVSERSGALVVQREVDDPALPRAAAELRAAVALVMASPVISTGPSLYFVCPARS